jgi:hypothetical protein
MSLRTKCPHCDREAVLVAEALGKSVRCKGCSKPFTARPAGKVGSDPEMRAAVKAGAPAAGAATATKARSRPLADSDEDDDPPTRHGHREESKTTLWIGLSAIGAVTALASALVFMLIVNRHPLPQLLAHAPPPPVPQPQPAAVPVPLPVKVAAVEPPPVVKVPPRPVDPPPKIDPVVEAAPKAAEGPPSLYGKQGGEQILPAFLAPHTLMRARFEDSFYQIDNARVMPNGDNPRGAFLVHFRMAERGKLFATHVMLRLPGNKTEISSFGNYFESNDGTLRINRDPKGSSQFPEDIECFLVRIDGNFGSPAGRFLVSDTARIGNPGETTRPRDWTPAEIARFTKEGPSGLKENARFTKEGASGLKENANPGIGTDTAFAGTANGSLFGRRFVDPKLPLLGLEYRLGEWAGEKCLGELRPIFSHDQNTRLPQSEKAKEGYAVSGAEVQVRNNIDAIKLHYRRLKADGSLDPNDVHESPWFGVTNPAARIITLGDTGPRVLGFHTRSGLVVDGFALVLER